MRSTSVPVEEMFCCMKSSPHSDPKAFLSTPPVSVRYTIISLHICRLTPASHSHQVQTPTDSSSTQHCYTASLGRFRLLLPQTKIFFLGRFFLCQRKNSLKQRSPLSAATLPNDERFRSSCTIPDRALTRPNKVSRKIAEDSAPG